MKPILSKLLDLKDKGNESSEPVGKNTNLVLRVKKKKEGWYQTWRRTCKQVQCSFQISKCNQTKEFIMSHTGIRVSSLQKIVLHLQELKRMLFTCASPQQSSEKEPQPARDNLGRRNDGEYAFVELELKQSRDKEQQVNFICVK